MVRFPRQIAPQRRAAFSLIEVMAAMAICVLGLAVVLQMSSLAQSFARKTHEAAVLQILCQNRVNEVLSGLRAAQQVSDQPCPEDEHVVFSVRVEPHGTLPLALLEVTVRPRPSDTSGTKVPWLGAARPAARRSEQHQREFRLARWIDPPPDSKPPSQASRSQPRSSSIPSRTE